LSAWTLVILSILSRARYTCFTKWEHCMMHFVSFVPLKSDQMVSIKHMYICIHHSLGECTVSIVIHSRNNYFLVTPWMSRWLQRIWDTCIKRICIHTIIIVHFNSVQLNFVKVNFIKTNNSLRRSESSVPIKSFLFLLKFSCLSRSIYVELFMCRSIFFGPEVAFSS